MEEFVFGTAEAAPAASEVTLLALETLPAAEAALPAPTPPIPEAALPEPLSFQSKENSLTHRLQAPDKEAAVSRFTVDMSLRLPAPQTVDAGCQDGAQESGYSADAVGGWVEGGGRVGAIVLARIKVVKNFFQSSKFRSGLAA